MGKGIVNMPILPVVKAAIQNVPFQHTSVNVIESYESFSCLGGPINDEAS